jgi:hypothetical protein
MAKKQYTIRGIPEAVDARLKTRARESGESLNQFLLRVLEAEAGYRSASRPKRDLSFLAGSLSKDPALDDALEAFDRIEPEVWS